MTDLVVVGLAVLGLVLVVACLRELVSCRDEWPWPHTVFAMLVILVGIFYHSELVVANSLVQVAIVIGSVVVVFMVAVGPKSWRSGRDRRSTEALILVFVLWVVLFVVNIHQNYALGEGPLLGRFLPGVFCLTLVALWVMGGVSRHLLTTVLVLSLGLISIMLPVIPAPYRGCDQFKCGVLGALLTGPFSSENYLGIVAATALILLVGTRSSAFRWPAIALCVALLVATGARSSQLAVALSLLVMFILGIGSPKAETLRRRVRRAAWLLPAGASAIGIWLIVRAEPDSLSNRGAVWVRAREALVGNELFGLGISRWAGYGSLREISHHFPHSQYLLVLFSGGVVGLAIFLFAISKGMLSGENTLTDARVRVGYATVLLLIGLSEIVMNVMTVDGLSWILLPLVAFGGRQRDVERAGMSIDTDDHLHGPVRVDHDNGAVLSHGALKAGGRNDRWFN